MVEFTYDEAKNVLEKNL